jgi:hypothetical protein
MSDSEKRPVGNGLVVSQRWMSLLLRGSASEHEVEVRSSPRHRQRCCTDPKTVDPNIYKYPSFPHRRSQAGLAVVLCLDSLVWENLSTCGPTDGIFPQKMTTLGSRVIRVCHTSAHYMWGSEDTRSAGNTQVNPGTNRCLFRPYIIGPVGHPPGSIGGSFQAPPRS